MRYTKEQTINHAYIQYRGSGPEAMGELQCKSVRFKKMCIFERDSLKTAQLKAWHTRPLTQQ